MSTLPKLPKPIRATGTEAGLVTPKAWNGLLDYIAALEKRVQQLQPISSPDIAVKTTPTGFSSHLKRRTAPSSLLRLCPFGKIVIIPAEGETPAGVAIQGGILIGGIANHNVEDYEIDTGTDDEKLIWLEVNLTANVEDDVLIPGLETCAAPTWETGTVAGGYPDNTAPDITTGEGTIIIPIGTLTITGGVPSFDGTSACGNITLGFCPPTNLFYNRG